MSICEAVKTIRVIDYTGNGVAVGIEAGEQLCEAIRQELQYNQSVNVSFERINAVAPTFLYDAIGNLLYYFPKLELCKRLRFINTLDNTLRLIRQIIEKSEGYYKHPSTLEDYYEALDEALGC